MKTAKIFLKILLGHAGAALIALLIMLFMSFVANQMSIFSIIATLIYAGMIYSVGWNAGVKDSRKLPGRNPDVKKAVKASLIFACLSLLLLIFRVICPFVFPMRWEPYGAGFTMVKVLHPVTQISDMIYRIFFFPCIGFMQKGDLLSYALPILIVPVFVPIGYKIGLKRFSVTEKYAPKMIYKNKDKSK